ncbi:hypothetical protein EHS25_004438 [Saitozyma podzolica]|uniref:Uncharacterized protein n=1 Tax=Saitozyma podzolica TaxID=1890683 RepID=A0A427YU14_9TREE|nr:hypothetical protein EHS25_004438 [Saitozyma podzolica]
MVSRHDTPDAQTIADHILLLPEPRALPHLNQSTPASLYHLSTLLQPHSAPSNVTPCPPTPASIAPTAADIKRKNANFAARAQAGKRTNRPARSQQRRSVGTWVLIAMGFLLVGGSE